MNVLKRMKNITMATVHEVLDSIENPEAMLHQYMRDLEEEIRKVETTIIQETNRLNEWDWKINAFNKQISKRERQAYLAVENNDEEIARKALIDQAFCEEKRDELQVFVDRTKTQLQHLEQHLQQMREKYNELRLKKDSILSRKTVAKTMKQMNETIYSLKSEEAVKGFQTMEEKLRKLEAESDTVRKIHQLYNEWDNKYMKDEKIEEKLSKLKKEKQESPAVQNS